MKAIGLLGGTFNPIHFGHLRMAEELREALGLDQVRFIPAATPPHKTQPTVSAEHRVAMVQAAIANHPQFALDTRELHRDGPSYTIDTLISLRQELGKDVSLILFMGTDAFRKLDTWHRWQELLNHCHIALVQRPDAVSDPLPKSLETFLSEHYSEHGQDLHDTPAGLITMQHITALDISSTDIRRRLSQGKSVHFLTPTCVIDYLRKHQLY